MTSTGNVWDKIQPTTRGTNGNNDHDDGGSDRSDKRPIEGRVQQTGVRQAAGLPAPRHLRLQPRSRGNLPRPHAA